jgi:hypothetical protein
MGLGEVSHFGLIFINAVGRRDKVNAPCLLQHCRVAFEIFPTAYFCSIIL